MYIIILCIADKFLRMPKSDRTSLYVVVVPCFLHEVIIEAIFLATKNRLCSLDLVPVKSGESKPAKKELPVPSK
jgi:hypothetical protein